MATVILQDIGKIYSALGADPINKIISIQYLK